MTETQPEKTEAQLAAEADATKAAERKAEKLARAAAKQSEPKRLHPTDHQRLRQAHAKLQHYTERAQVAREQIEMLGEVFEHKYGLPHRHFKVRPDGTFQMLPAGDEVEAGAPQIKPPAEPAGEAQPRPEWTPPPQRKKRKR
ncbi:MAG: hypothetical protein HS116_18560 [Planctomycetes bacterium]|nr:hypothetical protein [Planctomycetota bacterium]